MSLKMRKPAGDGCVPVCRNKFLAVAFGIIFSFLLLEIALRLLGLAYLQSVAKDEKKPKAKWPSVILCVGDSYTEGSGAAVSFDYPSKLGEMLRRRIKDREFKVINRGRGTSNTAMILGHFERYLAVDKPNLVVLMAGGANFWNPWGFRGDNHSPLYYRLRDFLCGVKVYKLILLFRSRILDRINYNDGLWEKTLDPTAICYLNVAESLRAQGRYLEAIAVYKKLIALNPKDYDSCALIGLIYATLLSNKTEGAQWLQKAIEINQRCISCYSYLASYCTDEFGSERNRDIMEFLSRFSRNNKAARDALAMVTHKDYFAAQMKQWISTDIEEMIRLCEERGVKVVLQGYPIGESQLVVSGLLKELAEKHSIPYVDNHRVFNSLLSNNYAKGDFFVPDSHCNARGYEIMAENVFNTLTESGVLQ